MPFLCSEWGWRAASASRSVVCCSGSGAASPPPAHRTPGQGPLSSLSWYDCSVVAVCPFLWPPPLCVAPQEKDNAAWLAVKWGDCGWNVGWLQCCIPEGCRMCWAVLGTSALVGSASAGFEPWSEVCLAAGFSPAGLMEATQCRLRAEVQMLWVYALRDAEAACPSSLWIFSPSKVCVQKKFFGEDYTCF